MRAILCVLGLLLSPTFLHSQEIGLEAVIEKALEENYDIRIARIDKGIAEKQNHWGNAGALPNLFLEGEASSSWIDSRQVFYNQDVQEAQAARNSTQSAGLVMNWTVFDGFRMFARKDRLEALEELGDVNVRFFVEQTVADLSIAYYRLKQEHKLLEEYRSSLALSEERLELEKRRKGLGSSSELEVKEARMDRNADSSRVHQQKAVVRKLAVDINEWMGRDVRTPLEASDSLLLSEPLDKETLRDSAMERNADLSRSRIQQIVSEQELQEAEGARWPEVELFGRYDFNRSASEVGFLESNQQRGPVIGARVRFNLYDGGQERRRRQTARMEVQKQQEEKKGVKQSIDAAFERAYRDYQSAWERVGLEEARAEDARELLAIGRRQYESGKIDRIEFRNIQLGVLQAESALIRARFEAKQQELVLWRLGGVLMDRLMG